MIRLLFAGCVLLFSFISGFANDLPPPQALAAMSEAELARGIATALEPRDPLNGRFEPRHPASAYMMARAWLQRAPLNVRPTIALAQSYLALDAPAAALELAGSALQRARGMEEARDLFLVKVRAHAELNDHLAAYASARAALDLSADPEDPITASLVALQWASYSLLRAGQAITAFEERAASDRILRPLHFTAERLLSGQGAIHLSYQQRLESARDAGERDVILRELIRYLALNEHHGMWFDPAGVAPPLYEYPELLARVEPLLRDADLPVYGRWVRRSLPGSTPVEDTTMVPEKNPRLAETVEHLLRTLEDSWVRQASRLEAGIAQADAAQTVEEIEAAWDALERQMTGPVRNILAKIAEISSQLETAEPSTVSEDLRARFAVWQNLHKSPLIAAAHLRALNPASGNLVLAPEDMRATLKDVASHARPVGAKNVEEMTAAEMERELKERGLWFENQMTEAEAAPSLFRRWAYAVLAEEEHRLAALRETVSTAPNPRLADFDVFIDQGLMTAALWQSRLRAAEAAGDWSEQVWSAYYAFADDIEAQDAWFSPRLESYRSTLDLAVAGLGSEDPADQAAALESVLRVLPSAPAHLPARLALFRSFLQAGHDAAAHEQLVQMWQLHLPTFQLHTEMLSLLLRLSDWPLLLEIADSRVELNDNDVEAHFHRQLAATAMALPNLAFDSVTALNGSHFHGRTRLLHWMEPGFLDRRALSVEFDKEDTGLKDAFDLIGTEDEDPAARIWIALLYALNPEEFSSAWSTSRWGSLWERLRTGASEDTLRHLDFLRGETGVAAYLGGAGDGPIAATARFLSRYLEGTRDPSEGHLAALAEISRDPEVPLLLRAAGAGLVASQGKFTPLPLRHASRYFISPRTDDWAGVWNLMAPGQQAIVSSAPDLTTAPSDRPLRIEGMSGTLPSSSIVLSPFSTEIGPLWELRQVHIVGADDSVDPKVWSLDSNSVLAVELAFIQGQRVNTNTGRRRSGPPSLQGNFWIESVEWKDAVISANALWLDDVFLTNTALHAGWRLDASRVHMPQVNLNLGGISNFRGKTHAHALFRDSVLRADAYWKYPGQLRDADVITIVPGSTIRLDNSTLIDFWSGNTTHGREPRYLDLASGAFSASNSRYICLRKDEVSLPEGWEKRITHIDFTTRTVSNIEELRDALASAQTGDSIHLRAGIYLTPRTLRVPPGVSLTGPQVVHSSPAAVIQLQSINNTANPFLLLEGGLSRISNIHFQVPQGAIHEPTGLRRGDAVADRRAIRAERGATVLLSGLKFNGWEGSGRAPIEADQAHIVLLDRLENGAVAANDGTVSLLEGFSGFQIGFGGDGRIFAPYPGDSASGAKVTVSGEGLSLHYYHPRASHIRYTAGGASPRDLARRENARQHLLAVMRDAMPSLQADLAKAAGTGERADRVVRFVDSLEHLMRAARLAPDKLAETFIEHVNPALLQYPEELPLILHRVYLENLFIPIETFNAHRRSFSPAMQERINAYGRAHFAAFRQGGDSEKERLGLLTMLNAYPPDHALHARAMDAVRQGQSLASFRQVLAQEAEIRRRAVEAAEQAAERARRDRELYEARLKAQQADAERRRAELTRNAPRAPVGYSGWSSGMGLTTSSYTPYRPSASRQLQDYSRSLDIKIRNATR